MIGEIPPAPQAMAFAVTVLVLRLCLCSLCASFGPLPNAPDSSPTVAAPYATSATPEVTQNTMREIHLGAAYHDSTGFCTVRSPRTWGTHRYGSVQATLPTPRFSHGADRDLWI